MYEPRQNVSTVTQFNILLNIVPTQLLHAMNPHISSGIDQSPILQCNSRLRHIWATVFSRYMHTEIVA